MADVVPLLKFVWLHELEPSVKPDWIWEGYIAKGRGTLLSGFAKVGKSTLLSHLLKQMSGGGGNLITPVKPTRVLVLSEEHEEEWRERRDRMGFENHVLLADAQLGFKVNFKQWGQMTGEILEKCQQEDIGLVVYDTFARVCPAKDENSSMEVAAAQAPLDILKKAGLAVLILHHSRKGGGGTKGEDGRGSGDFQAFADINMEFGFYRRDQGYGDRKRMLRAKGRPPGIPLEIVLELSEDGNEYEVLGTGSELSGEGLQDAIEGVLLAAGAHGLSKADIAHSLAFSPSASRLYSVLAEGVESGRWGRTGSGGRGSPHLYFAKGV